MSPRKTILRELARAQQQTGDSAAFRRPATIAGFSSQPDKYTKAVNDLLQARLLEGRKDEEGHMTIAVNAHRMKEVHKELRPVWAHPAVWAVLALALAIGAGLVI
jgi:hypothetical protein